MTYSDQEIAEAKRQAGYVQDWKGCWENFCEEETEEFTRWEVIGSQAGDAILDFRRHPKAARFFIAAVEGWPKAVAEVERLRKIVAIIDEENGCIHEDGEDCGMYRSYSELALELGQSMLEIGSLRSEVERLRGALSEALDFFVDIGADEQVERCEAALGGKEDDHAQARRDQGGKEVRENREGETDE